MNTFSARLGYLTTEEGRQEARDIVEANKEVFELNSKLQISLPLYKSLNTPKWKRLLAKEDIVIR
jgi:hypothetical protein